MWSIVDRKASDLIPLCSYTCCRLNGIGIFSLRLVSSSSFVERHGLDRENLGEMVALRTGFANWPFRLLYASNHRQALEKLAILGSGDAAFSQDHVAVHGREIASMVACTRRVCCYRSTYKHANVFKVLGLYLLARPVSRVFVRFLSATAKQQREHRPVAARPSRTAPTFGLWQLLLHDGVAARVRAVQLNVLHLPTQTHHR